MVIDQKEMLSLISTVQCTIRECFFRNFLTSFLIIIFDYYVCIQLQAIKKLLKVYLHTYPMKVNRTKHCSIETATVFVTLITKFYFGVYKED